MNALRQLVARWIERAFPPKTLGQRGEAAAEKYLRRRGYKVLARGERSSFGELDLVMLARDRKTIVFVEVKTRHSAEQGHPSEAVDLRKQLRITQLALGFLKRHQLMECPARFDIVAITWPEGKGRPKIEHIANAFDAIGHAAFYS